MPFISEEIWQALPHEGEALMVERYPEFTEALSFPEDEQNFEMVMAAIKAVRARRSEMNVPPSRKAHLIIATDKKAAFEAGRSYICKLAYASEVTVGRSSRRRRGHGFRSLPITPVCSCRWQSWSILRRRRRASRRELANAEKMLAGQNAKLANENFVSRARSR